MRLSRYEVFMKVIEYGSLTRAADALGYTQSAVSQIVQSLEAELDVPLLIRNRLGVRLTVEGEQLLPYIRNISKERMNLADQVSNLHGLQSGMIRIGSFTSISSNILPPLIKAFKDIYPDIQFELIQGEYAEIEQWINDGTVDIGFTKYIKKSTLTYYPFLEDPAMVILPKGHPYANHSVFPLSAFDTEPFILITEDSDHEMAEVFHTLKIHPRIQYRVKDDYTIMSMVENGLGISILPKLLVKRCPYAITALPTDPSFNRTLAVAVKSGCQLSSATSSFMKFLDQSVL